MGESVSLTVRERCHRVARTRRNNEIGEEVHVKLEAVPGDVPGGGAPSMCRTLPRSATTARLERWRGSTSSVTSTDPDDRRSHPGRHAAVRKGRQTDRRTPRPRPPRRRAAAVHRTRAGAVRPLLVAQGDRGEGVDDPPGPGSDRGVIETGSIALLSNLDRPPIDTSSAGRIGHHADRDVIGRSGLWNVNHLRETPNPDFLAVLEAHVSASSPR